MSERVLITGGAGFIGSHLADELLARGYRVRVYDELSPQVHGDPPQMPDYLADGVEFVRADIRDGQSLREALAGVDAVVHLAAAVGVGQSMYQIRRYTSVNNQGTAVLLQELIDRPVRRLVVASSMSVYGEGLYRDADGAPVSGRSRSRAQLEAGDWELRDADGRVLEPLATPEHKVPELASVYALSKYDQERLCLMISQAYRIPAVALRFFNVYGPRQALSNPYTGVLAIFAARLLNGRPPIVFEDGRQLRDFVNVRDVARAIRLALEEDRADGGVFNVGSGAARSVREIAIALGQALGRGDIVPDISGSYRSGDIRHCYADITLAQEVLGYRPEVDFDEGLRELVGWLQTQAAVDLADRAHDELVRRGLTVSSSRAA